MKGIQVSHKCVLVSLFHCFDETSGVKLYNLITCVGYQASNGHICPHVRGLKSLKSFGFEAIYKWCIPPSKLLKFACWFRCNHFSLFFCLPSHSIEIETDFLIYG